MKPGDVVLIRKPSSFKGKFTDPCRKAIVVSPVLDHAVRVIYLDSYKTDDVHLDRVGLVSGKGEVHPIMNDDIRDSISLTETEDPHEMGPAQ